MLADQRGVTALEYGLIAGLIALAALPAMDGLGDALTNSLDGAASQFTPTKTASEPSVAGDAPLTNGNAGGNKNGTADEPAPAAAMTAPQI